MNITPYLATALTLALFMPAACGAATVRTPTVQPKVATVKPVSGANSRNLPFVDSKPNTGPRGSGSRPCLGTKFVAPGTVSTQNQNPNPSGSSGPGQNPDQLCCFPRPEPGSRPTLGNKLASPKTFNTNNQ